MAADFDFGGSVAGAPTVCLLWLEVLSACGLAASSSASGGGAVRHPELQDGLPDLFYRLRLLGVRELRLAQRLLRQRLDDLRVLPTCPCRGEDAGSVFSLGAQSVCLAGWLDGRL